MYFFESPPLATLEYETYNNKHSKCAPKEKKAKTVSTSLPNPKLKRKYYVHNNINEKQLPILRRQIRPDFATKKVTNSSYEFASSESLRDFYHRISKQCQTKIINNLSFLAEVAQAANSMHVLNSNYNLSDYAQHCALCHSAMYHNSEVMNHALNDHHLAIEILMPIPSQQSIHQHQPPTQSASFSKALKTAFPRNSDALSSEP